MPDIDVDFCQDKERRGHHLCFRENTARTMLPRIITFGTMAAKAAIRMSVVPWTCPMRGRQDSKTRSEHTEDHHRSRHEAGAAAEGLIHTNDEVRELLDVAIRLEGLNRHASTHAAGVVISPVR